jgi:hypothetical protein
MNNLKLIFVISLISIVVIGFIPMNLYIKVGIFCIAVVGAIYSGMNLFKTIKKHEYGPSE